MDKIKVTVRLEPDTHAALKALAIQSGSSIQFIIEREVRNYLKRRNVEVADA